MLYHSTLASQLKYTRQGIINLAVVKNSNMEEQEEEIMETYMHEYVEKLVLALARDMKVDCMVLHERDFLEEETGLLRKSKLNETQKQMPGEWKELMEGNG